MAVPTIHDVAKRAKVSTATVSHVLNHTRWVSPEVCARVQAAVEELGYRPNLLARGLRRGETRTLGLILPGTNEPIFAEIARSLEHAAYEQGYNLIICNSDRQPDKEIAYASLLVEKQVDGLFYIAVTIQADHSEIRRLLERTHTPVVAVDREVLDLDIDVVRGDHRQGGRLVTQHLLDLGHRRIGCVTTVLGSGPFAELCAGYRLALQEQDIQPDDELVARTPSGSENFQRGLQGAARLLALPERPTAIIACNDLMALGVLRAARETGLRVPQDLAVTGCDDINVAAQLQTALTTLRLPRAEMGETAMKALSERMRDPSLPPRREILEFSLIVRESTAPPAH